MRLSISQFSGDSHGECDETRPAGGRCGGTRRSIGPLGRGAGGLVRQPGLAAARGRQRDEPRQYDRSGPAQSGARRPVPGRIVAAGHRCGDMPQFWASFNNASKRIQNGGWARQVTQADFQISETIAGVNMRLTAGGLRELHWHVFSEWAFMTYGSCRITVLDPAGHAYVADVNEGDLWFFPAGFPHSLQGLGPDGAEFILAFDDGHASEFNTLLVTDFLAHTPPGYPGAEFRRSSRGIFEHTFARSLHLPERTAGTARRRPGSRVGPRRSPEKPVHLFPEGSAPFLGRQPAGRCRSPTAATSLFQRPSPRRS